MGRPDSLLLFHAQFSEQASRTPGGVAIHEEDRFITFADLETRAERVASALRSAGIRDGCTVGLHIDRSIAWVVGVLAILKTNAAVVPLPPSYPPRRLQEILAFAGLDAVIDDSKTPLDPASVSRVLHLGDLLTDAGGHSDSFPGESDQPAFVLCSSGSTGQPKMIVRSHRSFFHRLRWTWEQHPYAPGEVCCQKAQMTTTHAIYELFEPLLRGIPVVIVQDRDVRNLESFWDTIRKRGISRLLIVPSVLRASLDMPGFVAPPLDVLVLMGEYLHVGLAQRAIAAFPARTRLYSIYGSTEASSTLVCDLRKSYRPDEELPLGTPISPDVRALVLGSDLEPVAPGEVGRLFMAGPALFSEYFRNPTLTASVVIHASRYDEPLYDTHDQVRRMPDASLQFIGRVDDSVKIRGFRVDLQEVERAILLDPEVSQAAVVVSDNEAGHATLLAFVAPATVDRSGVYRTLRERLPDYMVPSLVVSLDAFPLTGSSKVDRAQLLKEHAHRAQHPPAGRAPTDTQRRVAEVWERTLGHASFTLDDSFFEVGGTSLSVFALLHRLREVFSLGRAQLDEQSVYRYPTVEELSVYIAGIRNGRSHHATRRTPLLVTLRKSSDPGRQPFFVISSAGGTLGAYEKLSRALTMTREIIGVRDPFIWGGRDATEGFQRWVSHYVEAIRDRQPEGPYYLGAYSSAGAFGFEIARRLRLEGREVALLALIDPQALEFGSQWHYGYWVLRATWMRPAFQALVRLAGRLRSPAIKLLRTIHSPGGRNDFALPTEEFRELAVGATQAKGHLMTLAALLELNTGLPFALADSDFAGRPPDQYLGVLQRRVQTLTPEVDPAAIERIVVQYQLQVRTQHAYQLRKYEGQVLLVEPTTRYAGLVAALLRPHVRNLQVRTIPLGPPSERARVICAQFGSLEAHYRSMRDDVFVQGLAKLLDAPLR